MSRQLLSGNEAVALAARHAGVALGVGYPGTPSTEILEYFDALGGRAEWAPNEKVAFEVALGVAFGTAAALVTMKHVGLNVAADPFFTAAYSGVPGPLVVVSADDPGLASSQNEQDNRRYAVAAGVPMLEPSDSQEAYDFTRAALDLSARWHLPVLLRMTTRVCHSKTLVVPRPAESRPTAHFDRDIPGRVMIPAHARPAHRRLRAKLAEIAAWGEDSPLPVLLKGDRSLGIVTSGVTFQHVREAAPEASVLKLGLTYPLPIERIRRFVESVDHGLVIEEGDPYLFEQLRAAGISVDQKPEMFRFGELNVERVRRILSNDASPEPAPKPGKPPALCVGCPHRAVFSALKKLDCVVAGDIGCYTLGALPPFSAMDMQLCMGASIGMGLGLRHVLPEPEARRVVSVIGDSTFLHSGVTGLIEMVYNPPSTGHVVVILDNSTTAMTGLQENPATGRTLGGEPAYQVSLENLVRSLGIENVVVCDPTADAESFEHRLRDALVQNALTVLIARRPCILAMAKKKSKGERKAPSFATADKAAACKSAHDCGSNVPQRLINVVIAGLGGQGVLKASDILADAVVLAGCDVKKAEVHGMSQRGGSVACDVRFGPKVFSPMTPDGEADYLVVLADEEIEHNRSRLRPGGALITPGSLEGLSLPHRRSANVALLGVLSRQLPIDAAAWREAIRRNMKPELLDSNLAAFELGAADKTA
ncbi:MAG: 2-oxoacid:acceptor oxidoreductase family protein [Planctomycetaceae bacterium]|nr:2-oxoacid:acceptor oxidoreductase family protein [Planctomycetaceae bacterium]